MNLSAPYLVFFKGGVTEGAIDIAILFRTPSEAMEVLKAIDEELKKHELSEIYEKGEPNIFLPKLIESGLARLHLMEEGELVLDKPLIITDASLIEEMTAFKEGNLAIVDLAARRKIEEELFLSASLLF